jgi:hypothetical protein
VNRTEEARALRNGTRKSIPARAADAFNVVLLERFITFPLSIKKPGQRLVSADIEIY